jgi:hypothetical protein
MIELNGAAVGRRQRLGDRRLPARSRAVNRRFVLNGILIIGPAAMRSRPTSWARRGQDAGVCRTATAWRSRILNNLVGGTTDRAQPDLRQPFDGVRRRGRRQWQRGRGNTIGLNMSGNGPPNASTGWSSSPQPATRSADGAWRRNVLSATPARLVVIAQPAARSRQPDRHEPGRHSSLPMAGVAWS